MRSDHEGGAVGPLGGRIAAFIQSDRVEREVECTHTTHADAHVIVYARAHPQQMLAVDSARANSSSGTCSP